MCAIVRAQCGGGQRSMTGVIFLHFIFWYKLLIGSWCLPIGQHSWLTSESQVVYSLCLTSTGITGKGHREQRFPWVLRLKLQSPCLPGKCFPPRTVSPASWPWFLLGSGWADENSAVKTSGGLRMAVLIFIVKWLQESTFFAPSLYYFLHACYSVSFAC